VFDLPLEALYEYRPAVAEPMDFDAFWAQTLAEARQRPLNAQFESVDFGLRTVQVWDVSFAGYGGQTVKGWFMLPAGAQTPLPGVVEFIGYGGGRGYPFNWLTWPSAGYAYLVMDTRGQGSAWQRGDTPDLPDGANPAYPGFMTQGILSADTYYYRRVFTDAVRAVEAFASHPLVDAAHMAVTGGSQGGGISLAVGGLLPEVGAVMADVPFLCHFRRSVEIAPDPPYTEITRYLSVHRGQVERVFQTLSYFDGVNFAKRMQARALFSVGLMDTVCPPSAVFAAYNAVSAPKEILVYPFNNHEGGGADHTRAKLRFLQALWPV
jgi:cephalosporin-C deacetylase